MRVQKFIVLSRVDFKFGIMASGDSCMRMWRSREGCSGLALWQVVALLGRDEMRALEVSVGLSSDDGAIGMLRGIAARTEGSSDKGPMWNSGPISWEES
jgi:hypothetical protein